MLIVYVYRNLCIYKCVQAYAGTFWTFYILSFISASDKLMQFDMQVLHVGSRVCYDQDAFGHVAACNSDGSA